MNAAGPIHVLDLFDEERAILLDTLATLSREQWDAPTVCPGWSVKDIAAHVIADDLSAVSGGRDGYGEWFTGAWEDLLAFINKRNEQWVDAMRRVSPQLIVELLRFSGERAFAHYRTRDLDAIGNPVDWAGPQPAPVWLHIAREYTERWLHSQQIYDALGVTRAKEPRLFAPVLYTFVRALPHTYRNTEAPPGTHITIRITGDAGGTWSLVRGDGPEHGGTEAQRTAGLAQDENGPQAPPPASPWALRTGVESPPAAAVTLDQETAWRLFTRGIDPATARERATIEGDAPLGTIALRMVSIIA
jgi:uncharacterized protein (TIGR03083 family)